MGRSELHSPNDARTLPNAVPMRFSAATAAGAAKEANSRHHIEGGGWLGGIAMHASLKHSAVPSIEPQNADQTLGCLYFFSRFPLAAHDVAF